MQRFIQTITRQAGAMVLRSFGKVGVQYTKQNAGDVVTAADLAANRFLVKAIRARFPTHGIISEEQRALRPDAEYLWLIDPLDGTRNFATGTPLFGVMVALVHRGELEFSAIAIPLERRLYFAQRGCGAVCNGAHIHCSATRRWAHSYGCYSAWLRSGKIAYLERIVASARRTPISMNLIGAGAITAAYLADGRRDWSVGIGGAPWDYAAPTLLMREAGCTVTNFQGRPWCVGDVGIVSAPPALHGTLLALVRGK